nr:CMF_HP1_G0046350.mRNA.1.CDS.1 [Saccharomyces cerevisiae]
MIGTSLRIVGGAHYFWKTSKICGNISRIQKVSPTNTINHGFLWISSKAEKSPPFFVVQGLSLERKVDFIDVAESVNDSFENDTELEEYEDFHDCQEECSAGSRQNHRVDFIGKDSCRNQISSNFLTTNYDALDERI